MTTPDLTTISLGAGVQSTALYVMAARGELDRVPNAAIFADTQAEPPWVYEHLERLRDAYGETIPIHVVTAGNLADQVLASKDGDTRWASVPLWVLGSDNRESLLRRQCTREFKIDPIKKHTRTLLGLKPGERAKDRVQAEEWIGISLDEAHRAKPSRYPWITSRWPLLERRMTREDCLIYMDSLGLPRPEKSSCYFCPYHDNHFWITLREKSPETWEQAVTYDKKLREGGKLRGVTGDAFLHRSLQPLDSINWDEIDAIDQLELDFGNECEGMCGV